MKNKVLKRVLAVLLCVCVFCCSFTLTSFAVSPTAIAIARWVVDELIEYAWDNIKTNSDPAVILENKTRFVATLRDFAQRHNMDYDTAYDWLVDCVVEAPEASEMAAKYGDNWSEMYSIMHTPVWQLCNNYIYQMDIGTLAKLITEKDSTSAPTITDDNKVQIPAKDFNDFVDKSNTQYFPKNAAGKVSYRTDERCRSVFDHYSYASCYHPLTKFTAVGGLDEMYFVYFYQTNDETFYSGYQFHLIVSQTGQGYTLMLEYWDMIDSEISNSMKVNVFSDFKCDTFSFDIKHFPFNNNTGSFGGFDFYCYSTFDNYTTLNNSNRETFPFAGNDDLAQFFVTDLSRSIIGGDTIRSHFTKCKDLSSHDSTCSFNGQCDFGYLASATPISMVYNIETPKIPDNYYITISGDTVYDYSITNPETGQSDTINNYITNNYTYVTNNNPGGSDTESDGGVGGNVTVGGNIGVSGSVGVDITVSVPDININVNDSNGGVSGSPAGSSYDIPDTDIFNSYYNDALDETTGFRAFLGSFFSFLPPEILMLLGIGLTFVILCRIFGR